MNLPPTDFATTVNLPNFFGPLRRNNKLVDLGNIPFPVLSTELTPWTSMIMVFHKGLRHPSGKEGLFGLPVSSNFPKLLTCL